MSRPQQFRLNLRCVVRDLLACDWRKLAFHWAGLRRAIGR